jgi:hypothetical protein
LWEEGCGSSRNAGDEPGPSGSVAGIIDEIGLVEQEVVVTQKTEDGTRVEIEVAPKAIHLTCGMWVNLPLRCNRTSAICSSLQ